MTESKKTEPGGEYPLFQMDVDGNEHWLPLRRAGIKYDDGRIPVAIGGLVLDAPGEARPITDAERTKIVDIADDYSASM